MEPATMSDLKVLMKELREELRESIKEVVAAAFGNSKPALEHATTPTASLLLATDNSDANTEVSAPACSSPDPDTPAPDLAPTPAALPPTLKAATSCFTMPPTIIPNTMAGLPLSTTPVHTPEFVVPVTTLLSSPTAGTTCTADLDTVGVYVTEMSLRLEEMFRATRAIAMVSSTQSLKLSVNGKLQRSTPIWCSTICVDDMDILMPAFKPSMTSTIVQERQVLRPMPWPSFLNDQAAHGPAPYHSDSAIAKTHEAEHIGKPFLWSRPDSKLKNLHAMWLLIERILGWSLYLLVSVKITDKQDVPCNIVCLRFQQLGVFAVHLSDGNSLCSCEWKFFK